MLGYLRNAAESLMVALIMAAPFLAVLGVVALAFRRQLAAFEADAAHVLEQQGRGHG